MFEKHREDNVVRNLSTFYLEILEDFLPEHLILTIMMDAPTPQTFHLSIEQ